jgi:hypothetical protein
MQSVSYTAVPVFSIAAIWFLGFGLCLLLLIVGHFCRKSEPYGYSTTCYSVSLILLILFTFTTLYVQISLFRCFTGFGFLVGSALQNYMSFTVLQDWMCSSVYWTR